MVNVDDVIISHFKKISKVHNTGDFHTCAHLCSNIIQFSWNLQKETELFIGEVLESSYSQLTEINYHVNTDSSIPKQKIQSDLAPILENIIECYKTHNISDLHKALSTFRYIVTCHQLNIGILHGT